MDKKPENIGDLGEFFNIIGKAKKQKEDEFRSVVGDINLDGIFDNLKEENKKIKKKKKKEKKQIEQLEKFLFEDVDKKEEPKKEEIPEDQEIPDENTKVGLTEKVEEVEEEIVAEVESEEIQENDHVDEAIKVLDKIVSNKEEISEETDYELIKKEIKELRTLIHRNVNGTSGGGEVRLEFLDDVDRDSAKVNGKFLKYDSSSGKFVGASGGAGSQDLNDTLGIGNTSDVGMSVGVVTATSFVGNGDNLTGIVTSIVAGSNVTISGSTGRVTINASGGGGGGGTGGKFNDDQTNSGIHTTSSNVGLGTTNPRYQLEVGSVGAGGTQLWVNGDARITGILSVGTATITLDPTSNKVQIGTGITIDATTNTIEVAGSKIADTSGNSAFTGIVTATSFVKSGGTSSQFLKADGSVDTSTYSTTTAVGLATAGLASEDFVGLSTAGISTSGLASEVYVGLSTFTGDYNNLRNKPTIPTNNNQLTNGAGYITGYTVTQSDVTSHESALTITESQISDFGTYATVASVGLATAGLASEDFVGLSTTGLASEDFVGLSTTGLASEDFVGLSTAGISTVGLASEDFVGLATAGLASEDFVGLSTAGISTSGLASETYVGLSTFTGDYNNLRNKPTIPTNNNELTNGAGYITGISGIDTTGTSFFNQLNVSGVVTATSIDSATLNSVANLNVASNALTIGTSADTVTIAGNLVVSGTETIIDVERLEVGDNNIGIASTTPKLNDASLDGAGITIYGSEGDKTLTWSNSNSRMEFNTALSASSFTTSGAVTAGSLSVSGSYGLSSKYTHQKITSSGSATETLNQDGRTATDIIIFVNGIAFLPTDDYSVSGTTLTFVEAPASGAVISVRYLPT